VLMNVCCSEKVFSMRFQHDLTRSFYFLEA